MVQYIDLVGDTICAQVTAPGYSGVAVIRISGDKALAITRTLCPELPHALDSHRVYLTSLTHPQTLAKIDLVLVTYFRHGKSFTGDEVVEVACHGSPVLVQKIVALYLANGSRVAEKGEFTFRAFYNGKVDLVQAESINQLVHSSNELASHTALTNMDGELSRICGSIERQILLVLAHLEAAIDFVEQDIDPNSYSGLSEDIEKILHEVRQLIESYDIGKKLASDWRIILVGATNVGKSSLFNSIFKQDKAIVAELPGTTRDLVQDSCFVGAHSVRFIDSAGLRQGAEAIEKLGIDKTLAELKNAAFIFWVIDSCHKVPWEVYEQLPADRVFFVLNKRDLVEPHQLQDLESEIKQQTGSRRIFPVSAKQGTGLEQLVEGLQVAIEAYNGGDYRAVVSQSRHFNHLCQLEKCLQRAIEMLEVGESPEFVSQELQGSLQEVQMLLGKKFDDEILDTIFSEFCLGK